MVKNSKMIDVNHKSYNKLKRLIRNVVIILNQNKSIYIKW